MLIMKPQNLGVKAKIPSVAVFGDGASTVINEVIRVRSPDQLDQCPEEKRNRHQRFLSLYMYTGERSGL